MAKKNDKDKKPQPQPEEEIIEIVEEPEDVIEVVEDTGDIIDIDEAEVEVVEEPARPVPPPPGARPQRPAPPPPGARPRPAGAPESGKQLEGAPPVPGKPAAKPAAATQMAPKQAKPTQMAQKQSKPTQMAPKQAKPTQMAPKQAQPTQLAPPGAELGEGKPPAMPRLSIDEPTAAHDDDVLDIIEVVEESPSGAKRPADLEVFDLVEADVLSEQGSSINIEKPSGEQPSGVDIIAEELESQVGMDRKAAEDVTEEDSALVHDLLQGDDASSVDLSTAAATPPMPIEVSEDLLINEDAAADLDVTQPFVKHAGTEEVVLDEKALAAAAASDKGAKTEEVGIEDMIDIPEEAPAKPAKGKKRAEAVEEVVEEEEGGVAVATKKKSKRKAVKDEDDDDKPRRYKKPRYLRRWIGGLLLGIILTAGGLFAVRSFYPEGWVELNKQMDSVYPSPNATPKPPVTGPKVTPAQLALDNLNKGKLEEALNQASAASATDPEMLAIKGQAEALKYQKEQADKKAPLSKDDPLAQQALKDLDDAKQPLLKKQFEDVLFRSEVEKKIAAIEAQQKDLNQALVDSKLDPKMTKPEEVTPADVKAALLNLLTAKGTLDKNIETLTKDKEALVAKIGEADKLKAAYDDLLVKGKTLPPGDPLRTEAYKSAEKALQERKDLTALLDLVNTKLKDAKVASTGAKGVDELIIARAKTEKDMSELKKAAEDAFKTISGGKAPPADLNKQLVEEASVLSEKAKAPLVNSMSKVVAVVRDMSADTALWLRNAVDKGATELKLKLYEAREPLIDTPDKKLDTWIALFRDHNFKAPESLAKAKKDADWIADAESKSSPEAQAKAIYLQGLLFRNQEQFAEAKKRLGDALARAKDIKGEPAWKTAAESDLKQLSDPFAYYVPASQALAVQPGQSAKALAQINVGLKALPNDPFLLLVRASVQFKALPEGAKPAPEQEKAIRDDATAALKGGPYTAPEAHYLLGQLDERLGQLDKALGHYEQALASVGKENKADASRYQQAIGHLLLIDPSLSPAATPGPADKGAGGAGPDASLLDEGESAAVLVSYVSDEVDQPDPDDAKADAEIKNLLAAAEKFKKSDDPKVKGQAFMLYGLALTKQGKRTEGLMNYSKGLKMFFPGIEADQLQKMIESHPAFLVPDALTQPNPAAGETHFGNGLHLYFDGNYAKAEEQFMKAVIHNAKDARYHYYLGLAQHAQAKGNKAKEDAAMFNIRTGTLLEIQDLPTLQEINLSLERIQGSLRLYLDQQKAKAKLAE